MLRYEFRTGVKKQKRSRKLWVVTPFVLLVGGAYIVLNAYSPTLRFPTDGPQDAVAMKLTSSQPDGDGSKLYIPQLNIELPIVDESSDLPTAAVQRTEPRGNPADGGHVVLAGMRFSMGVTPLHTRAQSPFYHIGTLTKGDQLYVDYKGTRYAYEVTRTYQSENHSTAFEEVSNERKLTLYSYESNLESALTAIEAKPVGTIAWVNGAAKLKADSQDETF